MERPSQLAPQVGVEIVDPAGALSAATLRTAIAAELGVEVTDQTAFAPDLGRLTITITGNEVRVAYQPAAGTLVERTLALPAAPDDRVDMIGYIATNLVRDQAGEILAGLTPPTVVAPPPPHPTIDRVAPAPAPTVHMAATFGFVPPLAIDRVAGEHVVVGAGLNVLVGVTDGSEIVSIAGLVDHQRVFASGLQIGGLAASAGRLDTGIQIGGVGAYARDRMTGIQVGGVGSVTGGTAYGAQLAGIAAASGGNARALQIGGVVAAAGGSLWGMQIAGVASGANGNVDGMQIAGVASVANGRVHGMQIGGVTTVADQVRGAQLAGVANVAGDVEGVQVGVVNVARKMHGVQLGVVNVTEDGDDAYPIGLINYSKNGGVSLDGWVESTRLSAIALRHGTRHVHNVWGIAYSPDRDHLLAGAGLGYHASLAGGLGFDLDAMNWWTDVWHGNLGQLDQLRASVSVPIGNVEVFAGAAANVYINHDEMDDSDTFHPVLARTYTSDGGTRVVTWPSVFAGVRLRAR